MKTNEYLTDLKKQQKLLAEYLTSIGVEASEADLLNVLIQKIYAGGIVMVDQEYNPKSENAQSGKAVAEAVGGLKEQFGSIVPLDTHPRSYDSANWKRVGRKGYNTDWGDVKNRGSLKIGDIAFLPGVNTETNTTVLLIGEVTKIDQYVWMTSITYICLPYFAGERGPKGATGPQGPQGPQGPEREAKYYKYRDQSVKFELKKGRMYAFTVDNDDENSAKIVDTNGKTVTGVAGKTLSGLKNGMIVCADRCTGGGLTGQLSLLNPTAYVNDRWDWLDGYREQYGPYYLETTTSDGIDIWEI